tara:strand:- start:1268 stop:1498 length:231 start_codon:yes stop_codon:yes gene_type:complete
MKEIHRNWIEFCAVTLTFAFFFLVSYYLFFELRWCKREREMNEIIDSLDRDPQMQPYPTRVVLDTKTAEFRRVVFS